MLTISTRAFTKTAPGTYNAEASDIAVDGVLFTRIYQEHSDVGFILQCADTMRECRMYVDNTHRDREGDVTHWTLKSDRNDERRLKIKPITITVWND